MEWVRMGREAKQSLVLVCRGDGETEVEDLFTDLERDLLLPEDYQASAILTTY